MAKPKTIIINGDEYTLLKMEWNAYEECYCYYTEEEDEPFNDLDDDIEED